ncbi:MAG: VOC family protein [Candidatus Solibacter sp.]
MDVQLDHIFIMTSAGAPAAERLREFGLTEGSGNRHTGQGTACRRFFFRNAMLELVWVEDEAELRSDAVRRTQLWEHVSGRGSGASCFGVILRGGPRVPFASWEYRNAGMPGFAIEVAEGTLLEEPLWFYFAATFPPSVQPREHACGFRELTGVRVVGPALPENSVTMSMARAGVIAVGAGEPLLDLEFDGASAHAVDFLPDLPLRLRY